MPEDRRKSGQPNNTVVHTLDRVISKAGLASRTDARKWITKGRVTVDGKKVLAPETWVDTKRQRIAVDGKPLQDAAKVYLVLNKPKGYLTTRKDPEGRPTIFDLLPRSQDWLISVGRLDQDTSGLLILTNDTQFGEFLTNPESHVPKTYLVKSSKLLSDEQLQQLRDGLTLADGPTRPAKVTRVRDSEKYTFFEITITEGRNRQVRRMVEALEAKVLKLVRVSIGPIRIGTLEMGKTRELTPSEVQSLRGKRIESGNRRRP